MTSDHVPVPPPAQRSVIDRNGKHHQTNCDGWQNSKKPWNCNAHHILPRACFNPIDVTPEDKLRYILRCVQTSQWDINGGPRFPTPKNNAQNNMVRLPLSSAYKNTYPALKDLNGPFKKADHPVNMCVHNSSYSEHHLYIREVRKYLQANVWDNLQEDKAKHKGKGKPIKDELESAVVHFRDQLVQRGKRKTSQGNEGTEQCWRNQKSDPGWWRTFSMASDNDTQCPD